MEALSASNTGFKPYSSALNDDPAPKTTPLRTDAFGYDTARDTDDVNGRWMVGYEREGG